MASAVEQLIPSIYTTATGNSAFNTAMGGRIFFELAKKADGTPFETFPFAVFRQIIDTSQGTFTGEISNVLIQWSIFDNNNSALNMLQYITKLHNAFDDNLISVSTWTTVKFDRQSHILSEPDDSGVRHSATTYRVLLWK